MTLLEIISLADPEQMCALDSYVRRHTGEFIALHSKHPLPNHHTSYVSLSEAFWIWGLARDIAPSLTIESGSFHGYSAWWLRQGMGKHGTLVTHDPEIEPLPEVAKELGDWEHKREDFSESEYHDWIGKPMLAFFDDHKNQPERLIQAANTGIMNILFHDVYPDNFGGSHASLWHGLPSTCRASASSIALAVSGSGQERSHPCSALNPSSSTVAPTPMAQVRT